MSSGDSGAFTADNLRRRLLFANDLGDEGVHGGGAGLSSAGQIVNDGLPAGHRSLSNVEEFEEKEGQQHEEESNGELGANTQMHESSPVKTITTEHTEETGVQQDFRSALMERNGFSGTSDV